MNAVLTLAGLTIREALRRRVLVATLLIAAIFVLWAFVPIQVHSNNGGGFISGADDIGKVFAWLGCGMIKFFSSVLAVTLAAGAITAEVERGVLSVVVPKPLSRASIYLGKWLGLIALLAVSVALWGALLVLAIWHRTGTFHPHILLGILATFLFPTLFVTLTLCFSSFAGFALSAGLSLIAAGVALAEDMLAFLGRILNSSILDTLSKVVGYVVPLGKMNHWITKGLGDAGRDMSDFRAQLMGQPPLDATTGDLVYIFGYIVVAMIIGMTVFQKRDL